MKDLICTYAHIADGCSHATRAGEYVGRVRDAVHANGEYKEPEHALRLPRDESILVQVIEAAEKYDMTALKYVFVIGIGGSNLGTKAIYDALRGHLDYLRPNNPKLIFVDTVSATAMDAIVAQVNESVRNSSEILINLVSKSGKTIESIANFELLFSSLRERFPDIASRIVVTTDVDSSLWVKANEKGLALLPIPQTVGGRYSVFSSVGLFPLFLAGVNIADLLEGARSIIDDSVSENNDINTALRFAETLKCMKEKGCTIFNIFLFNPELESLGKWERQLMAESIGKEYDLSGLLVNAGITPIVSVGSTDLHSVAQLYLGGPKDKFTMFVLAGGENDRRIGDHLYWNNLVTGIERKRLSDIMEAIFLGTCKAYNNRNLPYAQVRIPSISAYHLGAYMEWRMFVTVYLARLLHVNAFDQPNVEDYKKETRVFLETHQ